MNTSFTSLPSFRPPVHIKLLGIVPEFPRAIVLYQRDIQITYLVQGQSTLERQMEGILMDVDLDLNIPVLDEAYLDDTTNSSSSTEDVISPIVDVISPIVDVILTP